MAAEYLPICDNLFNVISLAAYFCDCVFDIVLGYSLLERGKINLFITVVLIISGSLIVSQASFHTLSLTQKFNLTLFRLSHLNGI